jgi:glycosyltransferase involved in cell wall biosynthesis
MRIAIASSGLGHIHRGIEAWADSLALALHRRGLNVRLFQGGPAFDAEWKETLPNLRRFSPTTVNLVNILRRAGGWRYGFGSTYQAEQSTFALSLWRKISLTYDILHVQDPSVALILNRLNRLGLSRPRVILGHGTEEDVSLLKKYSYLQHLAPAYLEQYESHRPKSQKAFAIPNFVDTTRFCPGHRLAARKSWHLPEDASIFLCVAAIKKVHKRIDHLIREFTAYLVDSGSNAILVIAGGRESDTAELREMAARLAGERIVIFENIPRDKIDTLYQAADVFVLASLVEMFPVALLEAMSSGLPIVCNHTKVLEWMVGPSGLTPNLAETGALANALGSIAGRNDLHELGILARQRVERLFSEEVVARQIEEMYERVLAA